MKKKLHWTQRPENKARLKQMRQKSATSTAGRSKAERIVKKKVGDKDAAESRHEHYRRVVKLALDASEVQTLMGEVGRQLMLIMIGGAK